MRAASERVRLLHPMKNVYSCKLYVILLLMVFPHSHSKTRHFLRSSSTKWRHSSYFPNIFLALIWMFMLAMAHIVNTVLCVCAIKINMLYERVCSHRNFSSCCHFHLWILLVAVKSFLVEYFDKSNYIYLIHFARSLTKMQSKPAKNGNIKRNRMGPVSYTVNV